MLTGLIGHGDGSLAGQTRERVWPARLRGWKVPVVSRGYERPQRVSERQSRGEAEGTTEFFGC